MNQINFKVNRLVIALSILSLVVIVHSSSRSQKVNKQICPKIIQSELKEVSVIEHAKPYISDYFIEEMQGMAAASLCSKIRRLRPE